MTNFDSLRCMVIHNLIQLQCGNSQCTSNILWASAIDG